MTKTLNNRLPWRAILDASRHREAPWADISTTILTSIQQLNLDSRDLGNGQALPTETTDMISRLVEEKLQQVESLSYYLKLSMRFTIFQNIVGVLIRQVMEMTPEQKEERQALMQMTHAVMLCSVRQVPFTVEMWRDMAPQLIAEAQPVFDELLCRVEASIMTITGNTVYSYFEEDCSRHEVDSLLAEAYRSIVAEEKDRQFTDLHGKGHTKLLMTFIIRWQDDYQLKRMNSIMPFLRSLDAHWKHALALGCRQGVERMYKTYNN